MAPIKAPNPFLLLGVFTASIVTFAIVTERRAMDPRNKRKESGPKTSLNAEKIEMPQKQRVVEGMN